MVSCLHIHRGTVPGAQQGFNKPLLVLEQHPAVVTCPRLLHGPCEAGPIQIRLGWDLGQPLLKMLYNRLSGSSQWTPDLERGPT